MKLQNKVALVTGASRGIGRGIAEIFAEEGADVAVNYFASPQAAEEVAAYVRSKGRRALTVKADDRSSGPGLPRRDGAGKLAHAPT